MPELSDLIANGQALGETAPGVFGGLDVLTETEASAAYAPLDNTPTLEELVATTYMSATLSTSASVPFFVAPFACTVEQCSVTAWGGTIAASDIDYWTVQLAAYRGVVAFPAAEVIAQRTTQATGGAAVPARVDWNFDAVTFDVTEKVLAKGDRLAVVWLKTGAAANWVQGSITVRYQPT